MTDDFERLRKEFPTLEHWHHFDIARKAPLPRCVEETMREFVGDVYERAGENVFAMKRLEETRRVVAELVGVPAGCLAFVKNTSEGINVVASGLGLGRGDEVLLTDQEHGANVLPWRYLERRGVRIEIVRARNGRLPVESLVDRMTSRTRVVAVSWVTYGNGYRMDLPALGRACRDRNVLLVVDGIQGVGVLSTPLSELGVDLFASGAHKGLLGLTGTAFLYCRRESIARIAPSHVARFSFREDDKWREPLELAPDARRFEYGNPNFLGLAVLKRSAEFLMGIGLDAIESRVRHLTTLLMGRADEAGLALATPRAWEERAGIVSFEVSDARATARRLREEGTLVSVKDGKTLRAAVHFYNTEDEVEDLVRSIAQGRN